MKVLLTGATGFLGHYIYINLLDYHPITTLNRYSGNCIVNLANGLPELEAQFDLVIHTAGIAHTVPRSKEERSLFYKVNVTGTQNLLQGLKSAGLPKKFVFISTVAVYGISKGENIHENTPLLAKDPYGHSKILAEQLVQDWCNQHKITCTILRLPLVLGTNPPGNLGAMIKGILRGYYFNVAGGKARKSMVLASDIANFILKAADVGGIYNLTDGYHPDFSELSHLIAKQSGKNTIKNLPYSFAKATARLGDYLGKYAPLNSEKLDKITSTLTFDDSKARTAFGWDPTPVLEGFKITQAPK